MSARQEKWVMVRIHRTTHAALRQVGELWTRLYAAGGIAPATDEQGGLSLDRIVAELLRRDQDHRTRARLQAAKRRRATPAGRPPEITPDPERVADLSGGGYTP